MTPFRPKSWTILLACWTLSCAEQQAGSSFDSTDYLRRQVAEYADHQLAEQLEVPFELDDDVRAVVEEKLRPFGDAQSRIARVLDFIFREVDLAYQLSPTLDVNEAFRKQQGNCLSFANLFVAVGRYMKLDPFYLEVEDYQRWDHRQGMVVSQGHIVAGIYLDGQLKTYDFLPFRVKSYRGFEPIDDLTAAAHFYNNLGAEALLAGDPQGAFEHLSIATRIDPSFVKAANNLGVWYARQGRPQEAIETYRKALEVEPMNVPLLTNLARAYQGTGRLDEAETLLARIEDVRHTNPFFFVYKGEAALARGDHREALEFLRDGLRADSETPEVHLGLVKVYAALGELSKAEHHLQRAKRLDSGHPDIVSLTRLLAPKGTRPGDS